MSIWPRPRTTPAKWLVAAALGIAAAGLAIEVARSDSSAGKAGGADRGNSVLAIAGQVTADTYGIYLIDSEKSTMAIYQWLPSVRQLRLMAARNFTYDLQLEDFNGDPKTSPAEIRKLVEQQNRMGAAETRPSN